MENKTNLINCLFIFFFFPVSLFGQSLNTVLHKNINTNGKVLNLQISQEYEGTFFVIGLVKDNNVIASVGCIANVGRHNYDIRDLGENVKKIDFLVTSLPSKAILKSALITPNLWQEIDILFSKSLFSPKTVNFVTPKRFKGYAFTPTVFLFSCILFCIFYFFFKHPFWKAALISFLLGTIIVDVTTMSDQLDIYRTAERRFPYIDAVAETQIFMEKIKPELEGETWTFRGKFENDYQKLFMRYSLADIEFFPESRKKIPKGTFIITSKEPKKGQKLVTRDGQFFLLIQQ